MASIHPCEHANVMKKVIDRMNSSIEEQQALHKGAGPATKKSKKKWGVFSGGSKKNGGETLWTTEEEEIEGLRVDFYMVVFLKFIGSVVPTIEVDDTTAF
jgi:ubiquitin-like-conjugating enzyme ATG3